MMRALALLLLLPAAAPVAAAEVDICHHYSCLAQARIVYSPAQIEAIAALLRGADTPARERDRLALALGLLYAWAGAQSDIGNDRGGDFADDGVAGRMDCIDHAESTTRLLRLVEARGMLRFHRVLDPVRRLRFFVAQHFSAVIEELPAEGSGEPPRYAVDTWFYDNGTPAVVLPLDDWINGAGPDV
jgi:hypothetical protein